MDEKTKEKLKKLMWYLFGLSVFGGYIISVNKIGPNIIVIIITIVICSISGVRLVNIGNK